MPGLEAADHWGKWECLNAPPFPSVSDGMFALPHLAQAPVELGENGPKASFLANDHRSIWYHLTRVPPLPDSLCSLPVSVAPPGTTRDLSKCHRRTAILSPKAPLASLFP